VNLWRLSGYLLEYEKSVVDEFVEKRQIYKLSDITGHIRIKGRYNEQREIGGNSLIRIFL